MKRKVITSFVVCIVAIAAPWLFGERGGSESNEKVLTLETTRVGLVSVFPARHVVGIGCPSPDFCCEVVMHQFCNTPSREYTSNAFIGCGFYRPPGKPARGCCDVYEA
jgi:hypothetical protein